jgi:cytochrome c oxidase assembly protein subunit 15
MALFALVVLMVAVGGLTRLTDSGLSITVWAPLSGAVPPLTAEAWQAEFDAYRQIPQY